MNFTPEEARHFLGLSPDFSSDEMLDAEEDLVFPIRDFFLRNAPLRPLWEAKISKLETIAAAVCALGAGDETHRSEMYELTGDSVLELIASFERRLAALRTLMAASCSAHSTIFHARQILDLDEQYMLHFLLLTERFGATEPPVPGTARLEAGKLRQLLKEGMEENSSALIVRERQSILAALKKIKK